MAYQFLTKLSKIGFKFRHVCIMPWGILKTEVNRTVKLIKSETQLHIYGKSKNNLLAFYALFIGISWMNIYDSKFCTIEQPCAGRQLQELRIPNYHRHMLSNAMHDKVKYAKDKKLLKGSNIGTVHF